jgi:hypothetical protein
MLCSPTPIIVYFLCAVSFLLWCFLHLAAYLLPFLITELVAGAPVVPVSQTNLGASRSPATHSSLSLDTDLGKLVEHHQLFPNHENLYPHD